MPEQTLSKPPSQDAIGAHGATYLLELDFSALLVDWIKMSQEERRKRVLARRLVAVVENYCHQRGHVIRFKPPKSGSKNGASHR